MVDLDVGPVVRERVDDGLEVGGEAHAGGRVHGLRHVVDEPLDLAGLARDSLGLLELEAAAQEVRIALRTDPAPIEGDAEALRGADFVYVKNWSTFSDYGKIYCNDPDWMLTEEKLKQTNNARIMHCLPVRRNIELSDEVLDGQHSIVTQQASNRVWAAQAVLSEILKSNG